MLESRPILTHEREVGLPERAVVRPVQRIEEVQAAEAVAVSVLTAARG